MPLKVHQFPCRSDNYGFLAHDADQGLTACIDTPDDDAINAGLEEKGWRLTHILNTHHHGDHTGANLSLKERWGCTIVGAANDAERIPGIDVRVSDGDAYAFGSMNAKILEVPGHTTGHIAYYFASEDIAFVGDTLFALGCGRLFEGSPSMMWNSLQKLMALPDETIVYCAHEYTDNNIAFAVSVDPNNLALRTREAVVRAKRARGEPTVPSRLGEELAANPFLRADQTDLQTALGMVGADPVKVFTEVRNRKDTF